MHVQIVYAHPEPASFNGSFARIAEQTLSDLGHDVKVSDLYGSGFDPVERGGHYEHRMRRRSRLWPNSAMRGRLTRCRRTSATRSATLSGPIW